MLWPVCFNFFCDGRVLRKPLLEGQTEYQPYVEDEGRRIKISITPMRVDAVAGPTYTYIIDKLKIPDSLMVILTLSSILDIFRVLLQFY
jgi:hypothetical protein